MAKLSAVPLRNHKGSQRDCKKGVRPEPRRAIKRGGKTEVQCDVESRVDLLSRFARDTYAEVACILVWFCALGALGLVALEYFR